MPVREQTLRSLRAQSKEYGDEGYGQVEDAASGGIKYPVEGESEDEEGEEVEDFVVGLRDLHGRETEVCCQE